MTTYTLPNGRTIRCLSRDDAVFTKAELWDQGGYLRHGIEVGPGARVIDVGANVGIFALWIRDRCEGDAEVHSFEPIPAVFDLLAANLAEVDSRLRPVPYGLSDAEETTEIRFHSKLSLWSTRDGQMDEVRAEELERAAPEVLELMLLRLSARRPFVARLLRPLTRAPWRLFARGKIRRYHAYEVVTARFRRLGDYLREQGIDRVDLLKIDTEGDELRVLSGIDPGQWPGIRQVALEVDGVGADRLERVVELLEERGFEVVVEAQGVDGVAWEALGARSHRPTAVFARRPGG